MSGNYEALIPARWDEDAAGVPRSSDYGDVYHSAAGALPQARHVFLRGNRLPERWRGRPSFTICETGFGLGHNFLATWRAWLDDTRRCARLHYVAFEAHPFLADDLCRAWRRLPPEVQALAEALRAQWPALLPGFHRLEFAGGALTLTLALGRIERLAYQMQACVDAFYLDGFAPRVNPEMWTPRVFGQMRRVAVAGATVATWCSAGQMRRDLRDAGFLVSRVPGFARKRDMTVAVLRPGLGMPPDAGAAHRVAVVGGGLAGAGVAQALALRGDAVDIWDPNPAARADARAAGALVAALSPDDDTRSRLSRAGLERARARWLSLPDPARPDACGALVCARDAAEAAAQEHALSLLRFPDHWVRRVDAAGAGTVSGVGVAHGGLWFPDALCVEFADLVAALAATRGVTCRAGRVSGVRRAEDQGWELLDEHGERLAWAAHVVFANAGAAGPLLEGMGSLAAWPVLRGVKPIAGQMSLYPASGEFAPLPRCVLSAKGYCLPPHRGWGIAGSTYRPHAQASVADAAGHQSILAQLSGWLPQGALPWLAGCPQGWAGWRAATRDHLPIVGAVPGCAGLWLACAYGSRGLTWSALAGDILAAHLHAEPLPVERELLHRIRLR